MARKKRPEDHVNHEAWAIPYGDLITLLLAFFVVMYAVSSVSAGKYRVLSDSMISAFQGTPQVMRPIQIGDSLPTGTVQSGNSATLPYGVADPSTMHLPRGVLEKLIEQSVELVKGMDETKQAHGLAGLSQQDGGLGGEDIGGEDIGSGQAENALNVEPRMQRVFDDLSVALDSLIEIGDVRIRVAQDVVELELDTDLLFPVGIARVNQDAIPPLIDIAKIIAPYDNPIRVEGHTDTTPINTLRFPSNWELSAARAANVVRLFAENDVAPERMAAIGYGEFQSIADNETVAGRTRNRRVKIVILSSAGESNSAAVGDQSSALTQDGMDIAS